jgi:hypothetical protein
MYVSELALWLGWAIFYGHVGVSIGFMILFAALVPSVRYEERVLEARFGEPYRTYRSRVPRWLGAELSRQLRYVQMLTGDLQLTHGRCTPLARMRV